MNTSELFREIENAIVDDTVERMKTVLENEGTCDETDDHVEECVMWFIEDLQQYLVQRTESIVLKVDEKMKE